MAIIVVNNNIWETIGVNKIKNIGIMHYQTGNTDGVSLEIDKWRHVLEELGYSLHICSGNLGMGDGFLIDELYHHQDEIKIIQRNAFSALNEFTANELINLIEEISTRLEKSLCEFIETKQIDLLIVNNIWSVGLNLPAAIAVERARKRFGLPAIGHHHDFYWERNEGNSPTCQPIEQLLTEYFPPKNSSIQHVVINSLAQQNLAKHKHLEATVIPNVFNFSAPAWSVDAYNHDLKTQAGIKDTDIFILQATRVIPRKGIELAIDFVKALNSPETRATLTQTGLYDGRKFTEDSRIYLVLIGYTKDDSSGKYLHSLAEKARQNHVNLLHIEEIISHARVAWEGKKHYSFWDAYAVADLVTYPSLWEGWGNQLLEAFQARLPVVLFEYPVYLKDIKQHGFEVISLGSNIESYDAAKLAKINQGTLENAANEAVIALTNPKRRSQMVNHNHLICQKHYSLNALKTMLLKLLEVN